MINSTIRNITINKEGHWTETNQEILQEDTTIRNVCLFSNLGSEYMNTKTKIKKGKPLIIVFQV